MESSPLQLICKRFARCQEAAPAPRQPEIREVIPLAEMERDAIVNALKRTGGATAETARLLGIGYSTLYRKIKLFGLESMLPRLRLAAYKTRVRSTGTVTRSFQGSDTTRDAAVS